MTVKPSKEAVEAAKQIEEMIFGNSYNQSAAFYHEGIISIAQRIVVAPLQARITELEDLREFLWLNHGCPISALYGDDGEMQCGNVALHAPLDFKKEPLIELIRRVAVILGERITELEAENKLLRSPRKSGLEPEYPSDKQGRW